MPEPEVEFRPQRMVDWMNPLELARVMGRVGLASIFGSYADKREVQAALYPAHQDATSYSGTSEEVWFDYIADVGDGFDATFTMAQLLARPFLEVSGQRTARGRFLIFGGDQVYPSASRKSYHDRTIGPYTAAWPEGTGGAGADLFAIPGNHDWYDGLTSFVRLFCQGRRLGAWQTKQKRSYFAVQLPHDWWVWGIDIQLEADIDAPQLEYFKRVADQMIESSAGRRPQLILVTGEPAWVYCGERVDAVRSATPKRHERTDHPRQTPGRLTRKPRHYDSLRFFIDRYIDQRQHIDLRLLLAGDLHHYARYQERWRATPNDMTSTLQWASADARRRTYITAGGGGAYLLGTHHLPERVVLEGQEHVECATLEKRYPSADTSRKIARQSLLMLFRSPGLTALIGALYLLLAWQLQTGSRRLCFASEEVWRGDAAALVNNCWVQPIATASQVRPIEVSLLTALTIKDVVWSVDVLWWQGRALGENQGVTLALLALWAVLWMVCAAPSRLTRFLLSAAHTFAHATLLAILVWAAAALIVIANVTGGDIGSSLARGWIYGTFVTVFGGLFGTLLVAAYFLVASRCGGAPHMNEAFAARASKDYKHFIRCHVTKAGAEVFVIGVDRVVRWDLPINEVLRPFGRAPEHWKDGSPTERDSRLEGEAKTRLVDHFVLAAR